MSENLVTRAIDPMDKIHHDPKAHNPCPPLTAGERDELKKSLSEGYMTGWPVVRSAGPACEGQIIDGFHRTEICAELGIEPVIHLMAVPTETRFKIFQIRANLQRRNMSAGQRGVLAVELKSLYEDEARAAQGTRTDLGTHADLGSKDALERAAKDAGIGRTAAYRAQALVEAAKMSTEAADLLDDVKSGSRTLNSAYKEIRPKAEQAVLDTSLSNEAAALAEIEEHFTATALSHLEGCGERDRAVGESVRLAIELDRLLQRHALIPDEVGDYSARPHTFRGTVARLSDWFASLGDVL